MQRYTAFVIVGILVIGSCLAGQEPPAPAPVKIWSGGLAIGGEMQNGNTERTASNLSADIEYKRDKNKFTSRLLANYASDTTVITARNSFLAAKYDYFFSPKIALYVSEDLLSDRFKDVELRSTAGAGSVFQVLTGGEFDLALETGLGYVSNDNYLADNESHPVGRLAAKFKWTISTAAVLTEMLEFLPDLESGGEYTMRNEAVLTNALSSGWSLKLAHILQHDSDPAAGLKKTDVTLSIALQFRF